ncbi:MAG: PEP/pyruvate-binding domain-containing protein, partial [Anaerolineales bacterium]
MKLKVKIPETFVCDGKAYQKFLSNDGELETILINQLNQRINQEKTYAVRSSANLEDNPNYSFAGQFTTLLNVQGVNAIFQAIQSVWSSAKSEIVQAYLNRNQLSNDDLYMAVLIQEMVLPIYSGVALSKNPVTGADEIVIEAIEGEGTRLMQSGHTPLRWINKWGYWLEKDESEHIPLDLIQQIVDQVKEISSQLGYPVDMEWVYDGESLYWVQAREITTLKKHNIYSNYLSREMMPGVLKPLSFAVSAPIMSGTLIEWFSEIMGDLDISGRELVKLFYYRAYFNMGAIGRIFKKFGFPAESLELLIGALPPGAVKPSIRPTFKTFTRLPGILFYLLKNLRLRKKIRADLNNLETQLKPLNQDKLAKLEPREILTQISDHKKVVEGIAYHTSLSMFFLTMYNRALKRELSRRGIEISHFDLTENMPELHHYYPSAILEQLKHQFQGLSPDTKNKISASSYDQLKEIDGIDEFMETFSILLERFGHLGDSGNDFSVPPWRETPDLVVKMVTDYQSSTLDESRKVRLADLEAQGQVTPLFTFLYTRAREYQFLREKASCLYTKGKVMFRYYYLALGKHFVHLNLFDHPEDIFYLTPDQIDEIVIKNQNNRDWRELIAKHKEDIERFASIQLPTVIYGDEPPPICEESNNTLVGTATSIGCYTGQVCVVMNMGEFSKLKQG